MRAKLLASAVRRAALLLAVVFTPLLTRAVVVGPYMPDASTVFLFHLNEPAGSTAATNATGTLAAGINAVTFHQAGNTTAASPFDTTIFTGSAGAGGFAFGNFGTCAVITNGTGLANAGGTCTNGIGVDYNQDGSFEYNGGAGTGDTTSPQTLLGANNSFTVEALIKLGVTNTVLREIFSTDAVSARGFFFRIKANSLEVNIQPSVAADDYLVPIPTVGSHAWVANNWYHVALVHSEVGGNPTNIIYWTALSDNFTNANAILTTNAGPVSSTATICQSVIGQKGRTSGSGSAVEGLQGYIAEVRISNVARAASQMMFSDGTITISQQPSNAVVMVGATTNFTVTASSPISAWAPLGYQWYSNSVPLANGGDFSGVATSNLVVANAQAADATTYYCVITNLYQTNISVTATLTVGNTATPMFTGLTTSQSITYGTNSVTLGGKLIAAGSVYPTNGSTITVTINGNSQTTIINDSTGDFSINYNPSTLPASDTPYTITYSYSGNGTFNAATDTSTALTVNPTTSLPLQGGANAPSGLMCEFLQHPEETIITASTPRFGWIYNPSFRNDSQKGYRIIMASSQALANAGTGDVWDSGIVSNSASINVYYAGSSLQTGTSYFWRVQTLDSVGQFSALSVFQQFNTATQLSNPLTTGGVIYQQASAGSANCYPMRYVPVAPVLVTTNSLGHWFVDFGNDAFGFATVHVNGNYNGTNVSFGLGELASGNIVNTSPGATIRYWSGNFTLQNGNHIYTNRSSTGVGSISPPTATYGIVSPFRYLELSGLPSGVTLTTNDVTQQRLQTEFDDSAATFNSSSAALNQVWSLCKYSMKALSFDGIYVDGDRERKPYEADAYIHMMSSYAVNNDFTMPRCSFEYLTNHLTWPTEWPMHMVFVAWADYQQTGDAYLMTKYYGFLTNKCMLLANAGPDGLVQSYPKSGNTASGDIIDWYRNGNTDGYVPEVTNAVINAFYYRCLTIMTQVAQLTGHLADKTNFASRASQVYSNYDNAFWNVGSQSYIDGEGTTDSSAHANFFPLAFGLVPPNKQAAIVSYLHYRIAANGGMPPGVYGAQYMLEGMFLAGDADIALGLITTNGPHSWLNMINIGSTITDEAWSVANKSNEDWNHAWGAAAGNIIPRYVLGLRPLIAGFGQILIQPQLGQTLSYLQGTIPTIRGPVSIQVTNGNSTYQMLVTIPGNVTATVMLPMLGATNPVALVDGEIVSGAVSNNWLTITNVGSGQHAIWFNTNSTVSTMTLYNNWAAGWFGTNVSNASIVGMTADPDGDGVSNFNEFVAGTNPLDATDLFHIANASYTSSGPVISVTVVGMAGRHYTLQHTFTLNPASWNTADTQTANVDNQPIVLNDSLLTGATNAFLRVMVTYP